MNQINTQREDHVLAEVKKAIDFLMDKTYEIKDFYSHILQIVNDNSSVGEKHKEQLERMMFKAEELLQHQAMFFSGHKSELPMCKKLERDLIDKIKGLKSLGYSTDRFRFSQPQQKNLF